MEYIEYKNENWEEKEEIDKKKTAEEEDFTRNSSHL